jgi:hypothetical protein
MTPLGENHRCFAAGAARASADGRTRRRAGAMSCLLGPLRRSQVAENTMLGRQPE